MTERYIPTTSEIVWAMTNELTVKQLYKIIILGLKLIMIRTGNSEVITRKRNK